MISNSRPDKISELDKTRDGLFYAIGDPNVSVRQLMSNEFILANTDFETWEDLLGAAGVKTEDDFETPDFNEFVKLRTRFDDWETMLIHASNRYSELHEDDELHLRDGASAKQ